jgi:hypothetical protein
LIASLRRSQRLEWYPEVGLGYLDAPPIEYDAAYWEHYHELDETECGEKLTEMRINLVNFHWKGDVVDVGIGGGRFICERPNTYGYDINISAMSWLAERGLWKDPYLYPVDAITCWDSLEHMRDPGPLLAQVRKYVFVSLPIFNGPHHALLSKHYKIGEHFWYFERRGLVWLLQQHGFECTHFDMRETQVGREDIGSLVFRRIA